MTPDFQCGPVSRTERDGQIIITESGSRYRVFPSFEKSKKSTI